MPRREIIADHRFQSDRILKIGAMLLLAPRQRVEQHGPHQILLGFEMRVERAVGQPGLRHDARKANRRDAVFAKLCRGDIEDVAPCRFLMSLFITHAWFSERTPFARPEPHPRDRNSYCITIIITYYGC